MKIEELRHYSKEDLLVHIREAQISTVNLIQRIKDRDWTDQLTAAC
jgi:hypothetical protein